MKVVLDIYASENGEWIMKFFIIMAFVLLFFNSVNYASAQNASEFSAIKKIIENIKIPFKRSENISTIESYLKDKKWISVHLISDKLNNVMSSRSPKELLQTFSSEIERICNNTMELREQYNWVEVVERYVDKDNNLLFSFNTKESCKSVNYNQSSKKTIQDVVRRLKIMKDRLKFPINVSEGVSLVDIYFHNEKTIIYQYLLGDSLIQKLGVYLPTFVKTYIKTACSDKNRKNLKFFWDPFLLGEELIQANGKKITQFTLNECN